MLRPFTLLLALSAPAAAAPTLAMPVDCVLGETCHIQAYTDADPTGGAVDHTCGGLSYDGHKGTDFALPSLAAIGAGVNVLAAAPGRVRALRDGMIDQTYADGIDLEGRDCGNGVVIDHGDGWETQYCHLRRDSIVVTQGQDVEAGAILGQVGLSGRTQFPHLHLSVRRNGEVVDPFAPDLAPGQCGSARDTLWADPPDYHPGGMIAAGFAPDIPAYAAIKAGSAALETLPEDAAALVLWGYGFGTEAGDVMRLTILDPAGRTVLTSDAAIEKAQAQLFRAAGKRVRRGLRPGVYVGEVGLRRGDRTIATRRTQITVP